MLQHLSGVKHAGASTRGVFAGHTVLFFGEVGERIRHHEGLNIAHERFKGGGQAADMCVYAADDELIAPEVFELLFERGNARRQSSAIW